MAVIPTYNERENLPLVVEKIFARAPGVDILIVDDNSPDGTGRLADTLSQGEPQRLFVLHREAKQGLGRAYVDGFREALKRGYDIVLQMDADLSHDPRYLPDFLQHIQDADLVIGSRYLRGISVVNWDFRRLLLSKTATAYVRLITGLRLTDTTSGFKCWRRSLLEQVRLDETFANGYLFQIETTYRAHRLGARIVEIPIIFVERRIGRSKMNWRVIGEALSGVLKLRLRALRLRTQRKTRPGESFHDSH
ncbi:MAG TPA: polyprenol monophosphomannose synthase [Candidatus Methylomirabilis sp.]|nr:polyprenol monophosphomannose synthase [Candidatus Methylomirabilis sp.]